MKQLLYISLGLALFGSWQLCQAFSSHTRKEYAVKLASGDALFWLVPAQVSAILAVLFFQTSVSTLPLYGTASVITIAMLYLFARHVRKLTDTLTSFQALGVYSLFISLVAVATHFLVRMMGHQIPFL